MGYAHVAQTGEHRWTISHERVAEIVEAFRRADYFHLQGYYAIPVLHFATQISSIRIDGREKFVSNYGASPQLNASIVPANSDFRFEMLGRRPSSMWKTPSIASLASSRVLDRATPRANDGTRFAALIYFVLPTPLRARTAKVLQRTVFAACVNFFASTCLRFTRND